MRELPKALTDWSDLPQWVAWNDTNGRKVPKSVGGGNAKSNDPSTWGTLGEALDEAERNGYTGVGIELDNGLVGIDLDDCVHDGQIDPWAQEIIDEVGSYAEISPSGTGVHILATADPQRVGAIGRANHQKGIEVYNHGRYFTVTGNAVNDRGIVDATDAISSVMGREFPEPSPEDTLKEELARLARSQVSRRANETVSHNVRRDSKSGLRFARVPMGLHTCDFCNMLASRGFVYWSKESAGEFSHWHSDCRCKVVPGVPEVQSYWKNGVHVTRGIDPSVEGYDPDYYFRAYELQREISDLERKGELTALDELKRNPGEEEQRRNAIQMRRLLRKRAKLWDGTLDDAVEKFGKSGYDTVDSNMAEALTYLPKTWVKKLSESGTKIVAVDETSSGRSQCVGKRVEILREKTDEFTIVHELMHAMDNVDEHFRTESKAFFDERTKGAAIVSLQRMMKNDAYRYNEMARIVDDAYSPYVYKDYGGDAYEVSSMGIQYLYTDPISLKSKDPKLFSFALRQLLGK